MSHVCRRVVSELESTGRLSGRTLAAFASAADALPLQEIQAVIAAFRQAHPHQPRIRLRTEDA
jgi:hypothetical protein